VAFDEGEPPQVRFQGLAEQVADDLRRRIIRGDFSGSGMLPKMDDLLGAYPVSRPTFREAIRILEAEGLLTVRRGRNGGSVVHLPTPVNLGYTLGLVLAAQQVTIDDVAAALREVEPACAALCAQRKDRARTVLPRLRALHREYGRRLEDVVTAVEVSREFHEALVALCGNSSLIAVVGALESLWSSHERAWATRAAKSGEVTQAQRVAAGEVHGRIIDLIAGGQADAVRELVAEHLTSAQRYPRPARGEATIDPDRVRDITVST
jgi:GntR family transcriptional repressor for pyruvate dehydrogenase complex